jgi:translation initiation factor IF-1
MIEKSGKIDTGVVIEALPNTMFRVRLEDGKEVLGYLAGKMRLYKIKVLVGDRVKIERVSATDNKGRITQRF